MKRALSFILAMLMLFSLLAVSAAAEEVGTAEIVSEESTEEATTDPVDDSTEKPAEETTEDTSEESTEATTEETTEETIEETTETLDGADKTGFKAVTDKYETSGNGRVMLHGTFSMPAQGRYYYCIRVSANRYELEEGYGSGYGNVCEGPLNNVSDAFEFSDTTLLIPGKTYYYRAEVLSEETFELCAYGEIKSFVAPERKFDELTPGQSVYVKKYETMFFSFTPEQTAEYKLEYNTLEEGYSYISVYSKTGEFVASSDGKKSVTFTATAGEKYYLDVCNGAGTRMFFDKVGSSAAPADPVTEIKATTGGSTIYGGDVMLQGTLSVPYSAGETTYGYAFAVSTDTKDYTAESYSRGFDLIETELNNDYVSTTIKELLVPGVTYYYWAIVVDMSGNVIAKGAMKSFTAPNRSFTALKAGDRKVLQQYATAEYSFTAASAGTYRLQFTNEMPYYYYDAVLYNAKGTELGTGSDILFDAAAGETFYISAEAWGDEPGTLRLDSFTPAVTQAKAETGGYTIEDGCVTLKGTFSTPYFARAYGFDISVDQKTWEPYYIDYGYGEFNELNNQNEEIPLQNLLVPGVTYYYRAFAEEREVKRYAMGAVMSFVAPERSFTSLTVGNSYTIQAWEDKTYCFAPQQNALATLGFREQLEANDVWLLVYDDKGQLAADSESGSVSFAVQAGHKYYVAVVSLADSDIHLSVTMNDNPNPMGMDVKIGASASGEAVVKVTCNGKTLTEGVDYTVSKSTDAAGLVSATVVGKGSYSGTVTAKQTHKPGDVNGKDGTNIMDVLDLLKGVAGITAKPTHGDVDGSGQINIMDVLALLKYVAGIAGTVIY